MKIHVSEEIASILEQALSRTVQQGLFFVGVEHVFAVLLEFHDKLPPAVSDRYLNSLYAVGREVARTAWQHPVPNTSGEIFHTPRCIDITNQAMRLAERMSGSPATAGHLLLAILRDPLSAPSRAMDGLKLGREGCVELLEGELKHRPVHTAATTSFNAAAPAPESAPAPLPAPVTQRQAALPQLTRDLQEAARAGKLEAAIGRDQEVFEILQIFTRKTKNNVILVGDAGVGKTQLVEGLARELERTGSQARELLPNYRILELNLAALMAGTQYRGAFEERLLKLLDELKLSPNTILFIDEIHLIMGAGATEGDTMDLANLLKPALARGEIRCIGATTLQEYRKCVEKDPAVDRRFQMIRVEELSEEATFRVLQHLRPALERHHGVAISRRAMKASIALTKRYLPNRALPDKAIDVLDQSCARYRLKLLAQQSEAFRQFDSGPGDSERKVTPHDVRKVVSQMSNIPLEELTAQERLQLTDLERWLRERLIGQDEAVSRVVSVVKKARVGLGDPNRPECVLLFLGPTGVGKTQMAKLMADALFGSPAHLVTFDMSEYVEAHSISRLLGAPPGYVGSDEEGRLTSAVRNAPFSILLFDEIEKAHPRIFDIFLPIFDEGRLKDSRGREVSFKNCLIILTSNVGAEILARPGHRDPDRELLATLRGQFRPEFINRIDEIVPFYPLLSEDVRSILKLEIDKLRGRLRERKLGVRMYQRAYEFLAEKGYNPEFGARELRRVVDQLVTAPISDLILQGTFERGDMIDVLMEDGQLVFQKGRPHSSIRKHAQ
ncbi:MAG: ATP-dependent Clp protease ATP-binding subunit [Candidatus Hydrogenedentes bacterium]|nr:ATP-dependent Clp protease ATP-binding subunit [Candidatus Hydrogenedentota bacterium]